MKVVKLSFFAAATAGAALIVGAGSVARADDVPNGTYVFYATDGNTALNGSSITFQNDVPVSWDLVDALAVGSQYPPTTLPLTPANSELDPNDPFAGVYGPDEWAYRIVSFTLDVNYYDFFEADNNLFGPGVGGGTGALYDGFGDPDGNWSRESVQAEGPALASDSSATILILAGALAALGACRSLGVRSSTRR
jgi:hypothetical protein